MSKPYKDVKNVRRLDATTMQAEVYFESIGAETTLTFSFDDKSETSREIYQLALAGEFGDLPPAPEPVIRFTPEENVIEALIAEGVISAAKADKVRARLKKAIQ